MSNDKYKDEILKLISQNGPMGVNAIHRELGIPLSTLQKYLHRQSYFKINEDKKWDLPENVIGEIKTNSLGLMTNVIENSILLLQSQLEEMRQSVSNALAPISTLKKGLNGVTPAVADSKTGQSDIDPRLTELMEAQRKISEVIRKHKTKIPEEHQTLILNYDHVGLVLKEGETYTREFLETSLYGVLAGRDDEIAEEALQIFKENQIEAN